ncbi:hypothetical protein CHS0354_019047, partial [Potamilus streckersoni]
MSRPFLFNSVVFLTVLGLYCGNLSGVVGADDGLVRIPLQKSQDVSSKTDLEINSSTLVPSNAFKDQISIIEGQLNTGLDALSKNDVNKDKFADAKRENVPLDTKPLDAVQIGMTQSQMNTGLDAFQASTKQPGETTEKQVQNAVVQNTNETTPVKENVNTQDGAQVEQNGVQQSTNAEANTQDRKQPNTAQQASNTQNSQKNEGVDLTAFAESTDESGPEVTDYSSELSVEFTSSLYPFTQTVGAASGENDKTDMLDSMQDEDDFQVDDVDGTKEQTKPKWFDEMMEDEEGKKEEGDEEENEDYINYDDEDEKVSTASEEDSAEKSTLLSPYHIDSNKDLTGAAVGNGKINVKENFVAKRPIRAEQSMVSFYTWILLVISIGVVTFLIFKNRHKVQGYILHFSRRRSHGSKLNGEEAKKVTPLPKTFLHEKFNTPMSLLSVKKMSPRIIHI